MKQKTRQVYTAEIIIQASYFREELHGRCLSGL